jgi:hypothetical protein
VVFSVVQRRTMSHPDMSIVGATTDSFILFENGVRRNRLVLPGLSNAADHDRAAVEGAQIALVVDENVSLRRAAADAEVPGDS